ncbi:MAG: hypothetical protein N2423_06600 [Novosphingobium sp.]|nr:hypothetical protein [Novosphingobium sp.]
MNRFAGKALLAIVPLALAMMIADQLHGQQVTVNPATLRAVSEADPNASRIDKLTARLEALESDLKTTRSELAAARKEIEGLKNAQKTSAGQIFANKADISKLRDQFLAHAH